MTVDVSEGTHIMVYFVVDPATGMPKAMKDMLSLVQVEAGGATPVTEA
jgi:hypothetical protein